MFFEQDAFRLKLYSFHTHEILLLVDEYDIVLPDGYTDYLKGKRSAYNITYDCIYPKCSEKVLELLNEDSKKGF